MRRLQGHVCTQGTKPCAAVLKDFQTWVIPGGSLPVSDITGHRPATVAFGARCPKQGRQTLALPPNPADPDRPVQAQVEGSMDWCAGEGDSCSRPVRRGLCLRAKGDLKSALQIDPDFGLAIRIGGDLWRGCPGHRIGVAGFQL